MPSPSVRCRRLGPRSAEVPGTPSRRAPGCGTKLRAAESGDVLAFQVDAYDTETNEGWSVLVLGRATVLTTEHEDDGLPTLDATRAGERRNHYVRLHCELLTGRRLVPVRPAT